jgi:hypothetical protein
LTEPLLDRLRVEYGTEKPSNKFLAVTELDSDAWVGEVKRILGKKLPLTTAGVLGLREECTRRVSASALSFDSVAVRLSPCR